MNPDTDNRTAALDAIRDRQAALNRFDAMSSIESSQGYRVRQQLLKEAARADVPFLLAEIEQSVRVSEVLDLIANMDPTLLMWTGREGKRVAWVKREALESEINQLAGKAET